MKPLIIMLLAWLPCSAIAETLTAKQQHDYQALLQETRCVTCLNQNLVDSTAPIALAMREEIYRRIELGESPEQVRSYLIERYGEFVSFRPSFDTKNALLWGLPWVLMAIGLFVLKRKVKVTT